MQGRKLEEQARGKSEATLDAVRKALSRFEEYTGARDFKTFRREQAIGFKERLTETNGQRTGETLSLATLSVTLAALRRQCASGPDPRLSYGNQWLKKPGAASLDSCRNEA